MENLNPEIKIEIEEVEEEHKKISRGRKCTLNLNVKKDGTKLNAREYAKEYYYLKQRVLIHCDCCNIDCIKSNFRKHEKTKNHLNNMDLIKS
jgi:hypothetical protein